MLGRSFDRGDFRRIMVPVMAVVISTEYLRIEFGPFDVILRTLAPRGEGMARCADPEQGLTRCQIVANRLHLVLGQGLSACAQHQHIRILQGLGEPGNIVLLGVAYDNCHFIAALPGPDLLGQRRQRLPGLVFRLGDRDDHFCRHIPLERKGLPTDDLVTGDRWGNILLDVFDDQVRASIVGDVGSACRVIHGVGHVTHQGDVAAVLRHLTQSEGASQDAHVRVYPYQYDVLDATLLHHVPYLVTLVADDVTIRVDREGIDLALPRCPRPSSDGGQVGGPLLVKQGGVIFPAVALIDWIEVHLLAWDIVTPAIDVFWLVLRGRCRLGS